MEAAGRPAHAQAAESPTPLVLTFEGITTTVTPGDTPPIGSFYAGGAGPNLGVGFSGNASAICLQTPATQGCSGVSPGVTVVVIPSNVSTSGVGDSAVWAWTGRPAATDTTESAIAATVVAAVPSVARLRMSGSARMWCRIRGTEAAGGSAPGRDSTSDSRAPPARRAA